MKNCIVLGCGRSGTSSLMSMLCNSGYYMGDNLYRPTGSNPTGYFESGVINDLNEDLLNEVVPSRFFGGDEILFKIPLLKNYLALIDYHKHIPIRGQRWLSTVNQEINFPNNRKLTEKVLSLIERKPFCYKDPRFSFTLPFWLKYLELDSTLFIVVFRHPSNTINSILKESEKAPYLKNRIIISKEYLSQLWISSYNRILDYSEVNGKWLFIHYEQILNGSIVDKISKATEAKISVSHINRKFYRNREVDALNSNEKKVYKYLCIKAGKIN